MGKSTNVRLSPAAHAAVRPGDTVSGRINQVFDRYLDLITAARSIPGSEPLSAGAPPRLVELLQLIDELEQLEADGL